MNPKLGDSRKSPLSCAFINDAIEYAKKEMRVVWCVPWLDFDRQWLFKVYPGGRIIRYPNKAVK